MSGSLDYEKNKMIKEGGKRTTGGIHAEAWSLIEDRWCRPVFMSTRQTVTKEEDWQGQEVKPTAFNLRPTITKYNKSTEEKLNRKHIFA